MRLSLLVLFITLASFCTGAKDIVSAIEQDSIVTILQPSALAEKVKPQGSLPATDVTEQTQENTTPQPTAGYRILVFSDNNARTARNEARERARVISEQLPQYRTYISYESPYWRLKVGDFISSDAAKQAAAELKQLFPQYGRELRIVKDRINIQK